MIVTTRRDGTPQLSPVTAGVDDNGRIVIATYPGRAKTHNATRHNGVSLLVSSRGHRSPDVLEPLVDHYRSIAGEHGDGDEYRDVMHRQCKALIRVTVRRWGPVATGGLPLRAS